ncbi:hypothetical protein V498_03761 [Pseudogymnoascus sp. VKM F-4517 (FW-2822)]|nr:hypothetical protein V498_03761 [Pseudogymnoascus sp. VKM F-4517 (FW-2822)]
MESAEQNAVYQNIQSHPQSTIETNTMPNDARGGEPAEIHEPSSEGCGLPGVIDLTVEPGTIQCIGEDTRITQLRALYKTFRDMKQNSFLSSSTISNDLLDILPLMMEGPIRRTDALQSNLNYVEHALESAKATSREIEKAVIKERRRNEFLKIENSRLEKGLREEMSAKRGSTAGSNDDEPKIAVFAWLATSSLLNNTSIAKSSIYGNSSNYANSSTYSPIAFQKWTGRNCTGFTIKYEDISSRYILNVASAPNMTYSSFKISRPLQGREQLDFSQGPGRSQCRLFLRSYWPRTSPMGCVNLEKFQCFRIWLN